MIYTLCVIDNLCIRNIGLDTMHLCKNMIDSCEFMRNIELKYAWNDAIYISLLSLISIEPYSRHGVFRISRRNCAHQTSSQ